ncbi:UbiA prenyltransferase family-domain-containing protein [Hypoxylon argillaceum]|nr:UbiA prenyltransferase family-domain-containing protein [Hypoxylon argillaceum]KAI1145865.1 UbiA prenyltransferase family-domain-containing protein [Nemania diffusa]
MQGNLRPNKSQSPVQMDDKSNPADPSLCRQYGGGHTAGWIDRLPQSWIPYVQLCRLSPPSALLLILFPHLFGVLHGAGTRLEPRPNELIPDILNVSLLLLGGSLFCNNASHAWNDLVDASIDAGVARTKTRPIPRGAITRTAALIFTIIQTLGAAMFLAFLPVESRIIALPNILATAYYPFAKRHIVSPQLVLGFCLSWGVLVGSTAIGTERPWRDVSTLSLLGALILWVIIFDTIYAHQDLVDDLKLGVKSTAVLFRGHTKLFLWVLFIFMILLLSVSGYVREMSLFYYAFTVGGAFVSVGTMLLNVKLDNAADCWKWFSKGFLATAVAIGFGLLAELIQSVFSKQVYWRS